MVNNGTAGSQANLVLGADSSSSIVKTRSVVYDSAYGDAGPLPTFDSYLTAEDRTQLAYLAPQQVQRWTKAKIGELMNRVRSLSSVCNASAPINYMLSQDVLMEVFSHLEPSFERPEQLNVLHVCRFWRNLLLRSAAFWVKVVSKTRDPNRLRPDGIALFHTFLQRTRSSPLTLTLDCVDLKLAETLIPHAARIVSLTFMVMPESMRRVYTWLEQAEMPLLEYLTISHVPENVFWATLDDAPSKFPLDRARFPRLRSLRHPIKTMDVTSVDDQLRELTLVGCSCELCRSLYQRQELDVLSLLTQMLQRCTSLQTLNLRRVTNASDLKSTSDWTISLPALRHLQIVHRHISKFLTSLDIPDSCLVELASGGSDCYELGVWSLRDLFPHDLAAFYQVAAAERIRARTLAPAPGPVGDSKSVHVFEAYINGLKRFEVKAKPDYRNHDTLGRGFYPEYQSLLPAMSRLRVIDVDDDARYMASILSRVTSGQCICPFLEELHVRWNFLHDHRFEGPEMDGGMLAMRDCEADSPLLRRPYYLHGYTVLAIFCDYIRDMLVARAEAGSPLRKLHVRMHRHVVRTPTLYVDGESWEPRVLRERMLAELGSDCVCEMLVSYVEDETE